MAAMHIAAPIQASPVRVLNGVLLACIDTRQRLGEELHVEDVGRPQGQAGLAQEDESLISSRLQSCPEQDPLTLDLHIRATGARMQGTCALLEDR